MENWRSYGGLPCVSDGGKTVLGFLLFLTLRVRLFGPTHGLADFQNKTYGKLAAFLRFTMCFRPSQDRLEISIVFDAESKTFLSNSQSYGLP